MKYLSIIWLKSAFIFNPIQLFFNGNFWQVFAQKFGNLSSKSVLDLACGTGELRRYIFPKKYVGVDINPSYITLAQKNFNQTNTKFLIGNALKFKSEEKFDVAFLVSAAHHLSDQNLQILFTGVKKNHIEKFILVDDVPQGFLAGLLSWLDDKLGGGKYFRTLDQLVDLMSKEFRIEDQGTFFAQNSFYKYRYIVACCAKK